MTNNKKVDSLKFGKVIISNNSKPKIIAEAAVEHLGSLEVAKKMALEAKKIELILLNIKCITRIRNASK